ncbi:hypothetical protein [Mesorhizobium loti]|uniref:hypothetical protein n=1 Tax=Rhizobium loti TaxID=381 RepID=UPI003D7C31CF
MYDARQLGREVLQVPRDEMIDVALALDAPAHRDHAGRRMVRQLASNTFGQMTRLAIPVSSSSVMNITPVALPDR